MIFGCAFGGFSTRADILIATNGTVKVGIDRSKGAAITWLSWSAYPHNVVNLSDPGRLIQQSYYAGKGLDRQSEGQNKHWSPWTWNPIQGGGIESWARVNTFERLADGTLCGETVPKLWDMPDEDASALMRQWTGFEPAMTNVVVVRCEFISKREENDRWGPAMPRSQEIPACYFTRNFATVKSYLGNRKWREESQPPGPPWGKVEPPRKALALFNAEGQGVALFSPAATGKWNFGPSGKDLSADPTGKSCMHMAAIDRVNLGPKSIYRFRYWLVVGSEVEIAHRLDALWEKHSAERAQLDDGVALPNRAALAKPESHAE